MEMVDRNGNVLGKDMNLCLIGKVGDIARTITLIESVGIITFRDFMSLSLVTIAVKNDSTWSIAFQ